MSARLGHTRRALAAVALAAALPRAALAEPPPCFARAELAPPAAFVGQQVTWRVAIGMRDDVREVSWVTAPSFSHARTERLPGEPGTTTERDGRVVQTRVEQRALFAERPGALRVTSDGLRCALTDGRVLPVEVPELVLEVSPLPDGDDRTGLVGPLVLEAHAEPTTLELGGSVRVTVSMRGAGNLWDAADPLPRPAGAGFEVFALPPELALRAGRQLSVQRIFRYDVVPRAIGPVALPAVEVAYFDPQRREFGATRAELPTLSVTATASDEPTGPSPRGAQAPRRTPLAAAARPSAWIGAALLAAAWLAWLAWRRRGRAASDPVRDALAAAARAAGAGDVDRELAALARALRAALEHEADGAAADAARAALDELERARFAPLSDAGAPDRDRLHAAIDALRTRAGAQNGGRDSSKKSASST